MITQDPMYIPVGVIKHVPHARVPKRAHETDSGFDLYDSHETHWVLPSGSHLVVPTGIGIVLPPGWEAIVHGRGGLASKGVLCHVGVVDETYTDDLKVILFNFGRRLEFEPGSRIAQLLVRPRANVVLELNVDYGLLKSRGRFGSTGMT